jgi:hypothetical protein
LLLNEDTAQLVKRVLYVLEDNLKAGSADYDHERTRLNELILRNKEYIDKDKTDEIKMMRDLEKLEKEIRRSLGQGQMEI